MAGPPTAVRIGRGGACPGTARTGEAGWTHVVPRAAARDRAVASSLAAQPRTPCRRPAQGADGVGVDRGAFRGGNAVGQGSSGWGLVRLVVMRGAPRLFVPQRLAAATGRFGRRWARGSPRRRCLTRRGRRCAVPPRGIKRCLIGGCRRTRSRWTHPRISGVKLASIRTR